MPYTYEAVDNTGREVKDIIDSATAEEAMDALHTRGLFVTRLFEADDEAGSDQPRKRGPLLAGRPGNIRDRMLLTQQMSMMLRAGSQVVPALTAIQSQIDKPDWRDVIDDLRQKVEEGSALSEALSDHPTVFDETFRGIVAAGESAGATADAFDRLAIMTKKQQEIKVRLIGALIYPLILLLMAFGVVGVLMFYVLPKFDDLYTMLGTQLPWLTTVLIDTSRWVTENPVPVLVMVGAMIVAPLTVVRLPVARELFDRLVMSLPVVRQIVQRLILAKIFRVWGSLVRSNVPLLEGLRLSRNATKNALFLAMMDVVIRLVEDGNSVGESLARQPLVPATMSSAITTGEQSGQLGESLLFLADYLDEENTQSLSTLTRLVEPVILVVMGVVVGTIAIALFLPLFDLTSAASSH